MRKSIVFVVALATFGVLADAASARRITNIRTSGSILGGGAPRATTPTASVPKSRVQPSVKRNAQ